MKKKILFMIQTAYGGGVEKALLNLLDCIDKEKYECELLLVEKSGQFLDKFLSRVDVSEISCEEYIRKYILSEKVPNVRDGKTLNERFKYLCLKIMHQINRITKKLFKINIMYNYLFRQCNNYPDKVDVAIDYMGYGSFSTYYVSRLNSDIKKFTWIHEQRMTDAYLWNRKRYFYFEKVYAVCQDCADIFSHFLPEHKSRTDVIHNILDLEDIKRKAIKEPKVNYEDKFFILSVGRLIEQKTFDKAIEAAKILRDKGRIFNWVILGTGPDENKLQKLIDEYSLRDVFVLYGFTDNPYSYMRKADLYVQTSKAEGYCTTITEATILGKAVITTDVTGVNEQLDYGKGGIIVEKNPVKIAEAVEELMCNREKISEFEKYNSERNYDYRKDYDKLFDLLEA